MPVFQIKRENLEKILNLLEQSYGEPVSLKDETDYFDKVQPTHWFYATNEVGRPFGFIRSFDKGDWIAGEVFFQLIEDYEKIADDLICQYIKSINGTKFKKSSFEIKSSQKLLISIFEKYGFRPAKWQYRFFKCNPIHATTSCHSRFAKEKDIEQIQKILAALIELETKYVSLAITQKRITVIEESNQIVAANYVFFKTLEKQTVIEVIATAREFLGKGYATKLLIDSLFLLGDLYPDHSFCSKIKSDNHASVRTHQKAGFIEVSDETELVLSKNFLPDMTKDYQ
ncbi:MAG: hypothetical protein A2381_14645 [Bdellovibrionales bacterium RIFOXYB1_FULL_37_110]|nr:MAG: hypothetical protein A2417_08845 [Bdellovibrionales bacterium RIFOXYC1_FULL_37_79]OFZ60392.1 MAG: hypothetical protein A2381_14645 [Bdellovibrionales bacterium RIFOXYB1_FULL_37_110]OFZ64874.1 MAG: hypothetical protein A2577_15935 [Bdellovibrionales bacterium RIFOXYD1_FULL_36_51]